MIGWIKVNSQISGFLFACVIFFALIRAIIGAPETAYIILLFLLIMMSFIGKYHISYRINILLFVIFLFCFLSIIIISTILNNNMYDTRNKFIFIFTIILILLSIVIRDDVLYTTFVRSMIFFSFVT